MRDFFIKSLEIIITIFIVVLALGVVVAGFAALADTRQGGLGPALLIWVGGAFYVMLMGGMMYLGLGIYHNTRRTAEAVEKLLARP